MVNMLFRIEGDCMFRAPIDEFLNPLTEIARRKSEFRTNP
jgi:hypothetical protein